MVLCSGRNNSDFWLACQLRDSGYNESDAESAMRDYHSRVPPTNTKEQHEHSAPPIWR
jgi:antirestriction protein